MAKSLSEVLQTAATGSGIKSVLRSSRDAKILFLQRFVRLSAYGATYIILVQFLSSMGVSDQRVGTFLTLTLLGDVVISFVLSLITDRIGRRKIMAIGAGGMVLSGLAFSLTSNYWLLLIASVFGVISPSGNEIGPFRAVEESVLSQIIVEDDRTDVFVWYNMAGTAGASLGALSSGWLIQALQNSGKFSQTASYRTPFLIYTVMGGIKLALNMLLSTSVEREDYATVKQEEEDLELAEDLLSDTSSVDGQSDSGHHERPSSIRPTQQPTAKRTTLDKIKDMLPQVSRDSLNVLSRLIFLFFLDSFASGMASPSWLTYFFTSYHGISTAALGTLFFTTSILATISNILALPLARVLGPLKTMAFTHLPSAIFLMMVPLPSDTSAGTWIAMAFLVLRACTQSMDQGPRQAFLAALLQPQERTAVLGCVNIVKTLAQAGGIGTSGFLTAHKYWVLTFSGAGVLKAIYDLMILWTFLGTKK